MLYVNELRAIYEGEWLRADIGAAMPSSCVLKESCGVQAPGWLNGQIPSREAGIVQGQVCFNFRKDCCYYSLPVQKKEMFCLLCLQAKGSSSHYAWKILLHDKHTRLV